MGYEDNQNTEYKLKTSGDILRVTGLWKKDNGCLKAGRISLEGWQNLQQYGEKTILIITENKQRRRNPNAPDYTMYAVCDYFDK